MFRKITCIAIVLTLAALLCIQACKSSSCVKKDGSGEQKPCSEELGEKLSWAEKLVYVPPLPECKEKDGEIYGKIGRFRHRWWHYYKRALSYMEGGFWDEAEKDLEKAIHQRGEDQWNARTYGMHFIDYFPNRELGVVYYYQAQEETEEDQAILKMKGALNKLMISLEGDKSKKTEGQPSAKALFYLERTYADLIELKPEEIPSSDIKIALDKRLVDDAISDDPVTISGTVMDEKHYIKSIRIKVDGQPGQPVFLLNSEKDLKKKVSFSKQLPLSHGPHTIEVEAENIVGKEAFYKAEFPSYKEEEFSIRVDKLGPMIAVKDIRHNPLDAKEVTITVSIKDEDSEISKFTANSKEIFVQSNNRAEFTVTDPDEPIKLVAYDKAGNQTITEIPLSILFFPVHHSRLFARTGFLTDGYGFIAKANDTEPPSIEIEIKGVQKSGKEEKKYELYLKSMSEDKIEVNIDVQDDSNIRYVKINGKPVEENCKGKVCFSKNIDFQKKKFSVEAEDEMGNKMIKSIKIIDNRTSDQNYSISSLQDDEIKYEEYIHPKPEFNLWHDGLIRLASNSYSGDRIPPLPISSETSKLGYGFKNLIAGSTPSFINENTIVAAMEEESIDLFLKFHEAFSLDNRLSILVYPFEIVSDMEMEDDDTVRINNTDYNIKMIGLSIQSSLNNKIELLPRGYNEKYGRFKVIKNETISKLWPSEVRDLEDRSFDMGARRFISGKFRETNIKLHGKINTDNLINNLAGNQFESEDQLMDRVKEIIISDLTDKKEKDISNKTSKLINRFKAPILYGIRKFDCYISKKNVDNLKGVDAYIVDELKKDSTQRKMSPEAELKIEVENMVRTKIGKSQARKDHEKNEVADIINRIMKNCIVCKHYVPKKGEKTYELFSYYVRNARLQAIEISATIHDTEKNSDKYISPQKAGSVDAYEEDIDINAPSLLTDQLSDKLSLLFPFRYYRVVDYKNGKIDTEPEDFYTLAENTRLIGYDQKKVVMKSIWKKEENNVTPDFDPKKIQLQGLVTE